MGGSCGPVVSESTAYTPNTCTVTTSFTPSLLAPVASASALPSPFAQLLSSEVQEKVVLKTLAEQPVVVDLGVAGAGVQAFKVSCVEKNTDYSAIINVQQVNSFVFHLLAF